MTKMLDRRVAFRLPIVLAGAILAGGRRTAASRKVLSHPYRATSGQPRHFKSLRLLSGFMNYTNLRRTFCGPIIHLIAVVGLLAVAPDDATFAQSARVGVFQMDASPPIGSPLAYDPCIGVEDPLSLGGVVIIGSGDPIVLCAVDWIGIANEAHTDLRQRLAKAAGTTIDRVSVHTLHQHDAPRCDFTSAAILAHHGADASMFDVPWARDVFKRAADAVREATAQAKAFDRIGIGAAEVVDVASNRRLLNPEGQFIATRYTACRDPNLREMPVGTIDPKLRSISFYDGQRPIVVMTYYATHPQSYYRTGLANPDFPGYARNSRQQATSIPHIHFNGAGGNIGAGKWNDGSQENRIKLAKRMSDAMRRALDATAFHEVAASDIDWKTVSVALPPAAHLVEADLVKRLKDSAGKSTAGLGAATHLAWLKRCQAGDRIDIGGLTIGPASILHMPGELFVEYQLAASSMRPDRFVAMAAYGDYGPGYIGTKVAYGQGGYETSDRASRVAAEVETVLVGAMTKLLDASKTQAPLGVPHDVSSR